MTLVCRGKGKAVHLFASKARCDYKEECKEDILCFEENCKTYNFSFQMHISWHTFKTSCIIGIKAILSELGSVLS